MTLDFEKQGGLIPAVIQDWTSKNVLMLGFMNKEALQQTQETGKVTFYSRTKQRLWTKGETSGNYLYVKDIKEDCDHDTLLIRVDPVGEVCHLGQDTCFGEQNPKNDLGFIAHLQTVIEGRRDNPQEGSYTTKLFNKGVNKIAQKVGEEAVELVIEAKDSNDELFLNEAADLMYHLLVLLSLRGKRFEDVVAVLEKRHK